MSTYKLTDSEKCLAGFAFVFILISVVLALCIGLVLPHHWSEYEYVNNDLKSTKDLSSRCNCGSTLYTTRYKDCVARDIKKNVLPINGRNEQDNSCNIISNYPYLVSLSAPAYIDDKTERRFACTGTILSKSWILVGTECVRSSEEWSDLIVRAGSSYWSKGGTEHSLKSTSIFTINGPVAAKIDPPFGFGKIVNAVKIPKRQSHLIWTLAVSPGWRRGESRKNFKFYAEAWSTDGCREANCNSGELRKDDPCKIEENTRALVTATGHLVGFRTGSCIDAEHRSISIFSDYRRDDFLIWVDNLFNNSIKETTTEYVKTLNTSVGSIKIYEIIECVLLDDQVYENRKSLTQGSEETNYLTETVAVTHQKVFPTIILDTSSSSLTTTRRMTTRTQFLTIYRQTVSETSSLKTTL